MTRDRALKLGLAIHGVIREDILLPQRVVGDERVCGGFEYRVLCISDSATMALKDFIGVPAELRIVTDRGGLRRICGIITEAASGQSDGGLATYQIVMRDALAVMEKRTNTRIFRQQNELEVIRTLVAQWHAQNPILRETFDLQVDAGIDRKFASRELIMQHNESDAAFIRRLLQRCGIAWLFRSGLRRATSARRDQEQHGAVGHTLFLFDDASHLGQNAAGSVRFHRDAATEQRDGITGWSGTHTLQPGSVALHTWDYKNPSSRVFMEASALTQLKHGLRESELVAALENYHVAPPHAADTILDLTALANAQMAYHEYETKGFHGEGGVRDFAAGEWFILEGHPEIDTHPKKEREFVITAQHIIAQNNLPVEIGVRVERLFESSGWIPNDQIRFSDCNGEPIRYITRFACVRRNIRIVPPRPNLPSPALQTAIVVGPTNEQVWCDRLGRVKIRFPATRPPDHEHANGAGSADLDTDSAWVRVASNWAGNGPGSAGQCGTRMLPPVGAEVLVDWVGGDPDKPIITGQLYNSDGLPPSFRHEEGLPNSKYQSGIRTREIRGRRGNQLRLDDTPAQISAQLASDHAATELNLGYLTEPRRNGSTKPRGEGAELRSDEAIALHAARGILLSTWKLLEGVGAKGHQLARDDYLGLLRECGELCATLGNYAAEHNGLSIDCKEQDKLRTRFDKWENGSNTAPDAVESGEPVIGVTSPAGIGFATSQAIVSYAARNIDSVAQQHLQMIAGQRFSLNAGKGISLFARNDGLTGIAHFGKLLLQSQHDDTDINSAKNLNVTATEGTVTISGKVILLVAEDGSFLKLGDGPPVMGSKQALQFHAAEFLYDGPESMSAKLPKFEHGRADQKLAVHYARGTPLENGDQPLGTAVKDARMQVKLGDGTDMQARSDADGKSDLIERDVMHMADIILMRGGDQ